MHVGVLLPTGAETMADLPHTSGDLRARTTRVAALCHAAGGRIGMRASTVGHQEAAAGPAHYDRSKGIFGGEPLGIFPTADRELSAEVGRLETWERCEERYLRLMSTPTPRNYLEEMVDLTEKGIMWQFPIDNEQGIDHDEVGWLVGILFVGHGIGL